MLSIFLATTIDLVVGLADRSTSMFIVCYEWCTLWNCGSAFL